MAKIFLTDGKPGITPQKYSSSLDLAEGTVIRLLETTATITSPKGSLVPVAKAIGTGAPIVAQIPFHLGYINNTNNYFTVVIKDGTEIFADDNVIILDRPTSPTTVDHFILIGYKYLEDASDSLLDVLGLDTKMEMVKKYTSTLGNVESWILKYKDNHNKPFSSILSLKSTSVTGVGIPPSVIPISYNYHDGRKVYKASIMGPITSMNESWRILCDTITFMDKNDIIIIYISSEGGDTQTASSVISSMVLCQGTVVTVATGSCASAGPVLWSCGHIRMVTDNAAMMVHPMAICDPSIKPASHIADMGKLVCMATIKFLEETVGKVGLATPEEIDKIVNSSNDFYHSPEVVRERTHAPLVRTNKDIWEVIEDTINHE